MTRTPNVRAPARRTSRQALSPEERAERLSVARQQLLDGVDRLMTSEGWQQLITSRVWLRRYSLNNVLMILQQCPEATDVRPLSEWRESGYGLMRKGTHKIKIWKPTFAKVDSETGDENASDSPRLSGFMLVPVVDVSQLQGNPAAVRPKSPVALTGDAPIGLWDGLVRQCAACGFTVDRGDCGNAYGRTVFPHRRVTVRADVSAAQAAKTLAHELAHILCEHEARALTTPRAVLEVEAESVACIVTAVCGLDTLTYSVPYVVGWAADRDTAHRSAERVLAVADRIVTALETHSSS